MADKSGIQLYVHCRSCLDERLPAEIEIGVTQEATLVVWCKRHELPVLRLPAAQASDRLLDMLGHGCDEPHPAHGN